MTKRSKISLIITVFNESKTILSLLEAISKQTKRPDEVVIVDGGSSDDTMKIVSEFNKNQRILKKNKGKSKVKSSKKFKKTKLKKIKIRIYKKTGNRSVGRNFAIKKSKFSWIAITDAGCIPKDNWLEMLIAKHNESKANVIAGYYEGLSKTNLEEAIIPYVLVMPDTVDEVNFLPATRSMLIKKSVFDDLGGFDESLSDNEDYAFSHKIRQSGETIAFARWAIVEWMPPSEIKTFANMIFRFARGDVFAGIIRPKVILIFIRYFIFILFTLNILAGYMNGRGSGWQQFWVGIWMIIVAIYISWSIDKNHRYTLKSWFWLPVLQVVSDIMVMAGSCVGLFNKVKLKYNSKRLEAQQIK